MRAILLLICCRSSKWLGVASMNGWSPPRPLGVRPTTIQILPGCLVVVGDTAEEARQKRALVSKCGRERVIERARRDNLTVRQRRSPAATAVSPWSTAPPATASTSCSGGCRAASTVSSTGSSPNSSAATSSAANTKAGPCGRTSACRAPKPLLQQAKRLVETLVFDLLFCALAFAQFRAALFFAAPETDPIFLRLGLGLGAPALLAVLIEVDDHRL